MKQLLGNAATRMSSTSSMDLDAPLEQLQWVEDWDDEDIFSSGVSPRLSKLKKRVSDLQELSGSRAVTSAPSPAKTNIVHEVIIEEKAMEASQVSVVVEPPSPSPVAPATAPVTVVSQTPSWPASVLSVLSTDPIARIFAFAPSAWGNVSYGQYVLQIICFELWPTTSLDSQHLFLFFVFLLACSWMSAELVTIPARSWWLRQKPPPKWILLKLWACPVSLAILLLAMGVPYMHVKEAEAAAALRTPEVVIHVQNHSVDLRLNWRTQAFAADDERAIINPSMLILDNGFAEHGHPVFVRAARAHTVTESQYADVYEGDDVTTIHTEWRSDILTSVELLDQHTFLQGWPADESDVSKWGLDGSHDMQRARLLSSAGDAAAYETTNASAWEWGPLCEPATTFIPQNMTLVRKTVSGPEDPKLLAAASAAEGVALFGSQWAMVFDSLPPSKSLAGCDHTSAAVTQMYVATHGENVVGLSSSVGQGASPAAELAEARTRMRAAVGSRIECGKTTRAEKNWIGFVHDDQLYFVYSIFPHVVVQARATDGACVQRYSTSSYEPLARLSEEGTHQMHGSATAVLHNGTFLALMHTIDGDGMYQTMAYKFKAAPPFAVEAVSRPLPLQGVGGKNFASGLAVVDDKVVVTYGAGDAESRALVMSLEYFETLFHELTTT